MSFTEDTFAAQEKAAYSAQQLRAGALNPGRSDYANAAAPPPPSFFDQMSQRIQALGGLISETNNELSMLGDRVFGGAPQNAGGSKGGPSGAGHAGSVLEALDILLSAASEAAQRARALNSRL